MTGTGNLLWYSFPSYVLKIQRHIRQDLKTSARLAKKG